MRSDTQKAKKKLTKNVDNQKKKKKRIELKNRKAALLTQKGLSWGSQFVWLHRDKDKE